MKFRAKMLATMTMLVLLSLLTISVQAQTWSVPLYGCLAAGSATAEIPRRAVYVRTGWRELDAAMMDDIGALDNAFGINVSVYFLNNEAENAFFTPMKFPTLIEEDGGDAQTSASGTVFFSAGLLKSEFRQTNGSLMSVPAILGHEFAHAMQNSNDFPYEGKRRELHADFMAGWFIGHRGRFRPQNAIQAFLNFYNKGDLDFFAKGHHGTPQERANAFYAGFMLNVQGNESSAFRAYNYGLQYVSRL